MTGFARKLAALVVLFLLPLFLRAAPLEHGQPRNYVPDAHIVRCALGMAKDKDLVPPVAKYSSYPYLLPYLLLPAYAAQYALGRARGDWQGAGEYGNHLLENPGDAQRLGRWLVALFGALTPWVVYRATRAAGLQRGAWIAALLVATSLLHVQFSVQERPWVPVVFFLVLAAWPATLYMTSGRTKHLLLSAAAAALSFACHQGGGATIVVTGLAWLLGPLAWRARHSPSDVNRGASDVSRVSGGASDLVLRLKQLALLVLVFVAVSVPLGHPYWLRYGFTETAAVVGGELAEKKGGFSIGGLGFVSGMRWESVTRLSKAFFGYDPLIVLLGLAGFVGAWRVRPIRPLLIFALGWTAIFLPQQSDHVRYLLPISVILAWPAGLIAERWLESPRSKGSAIALGALFAFSIAQVLRFDWLMTRPDARVEAEAKLAALPSGARVAIDRHGPELDLSQTALERLSELRAQTYEGGLRARERHRLELLRAGVAHGGIDALELEEILDASPRDKTFGLREDLATFAVSPRDALTKLGITHVLLVNKRPGEQQPLLLPLVGTAARPLWVVDPSREGAHTTPECFLPTEMDYPLVGLWSVDRPGPWMGLYELR